MMMKGVVSDQGTNNLFIHVPLSCGWESNSIRHSLTSGFCSIQLRVVWRSLYGSFPKPGQPSIYLSSFIFSSHKITGASLAGLSSVTKPLVWFICPREVNQPCSVMMMTSFLVLPFIHYPRYDYHYSTFTPIPPLNLPPAISIQEGGGIWIKLKGSAPKLLRFFQPTRLEGEKEIPQGFRTNSDMKDLSRNITQSNVFVLIRLGCARESRFSILKPPP